jgi:hypothetical protein
MQYILCFLFSPTRLQSISPVLYIPLSVTCVCIMFNKHEIYVVFFCVLFCKPTYLFFGHEFVDNDLRACRQLVCELSSCFCLMAFVLIMYFPAVVAT